MYERSPGQKVLLVYASQSGTAASIASRFYEANHDNCCLADLSHLSVSEIAAYGYIIFIVSSYGNGEPPTNVVPVFKELVEASTGLAHQRFAVLALGDRQYMNFCGFGHSMYRLWLHKGAQPLLPLTEVNRANTATIQHWWTKACDKFSLRPSHTEQDWMVATVMGSEVFPGSSAKESLTLLQLYLPEKDFEAGDELLVNAEHESRHPYCISICSHRDEQFVSCLGPSSHLPISWREENRPGYKMQVAVKRNRYFRFPLANIPVVAITHAHGIGVIQALLAQKAAQNHTERALVFVESSLSDNVCNDPVWNDVNTTIIVFSDERELSMVCDSYAPEIAAIVSNKAAIGVGNAYICAGNRRFEEHARSCLEFCAHSDKLEISSLVTGT